MEYIYGISRLLYCNLSQFGYIILGTPCINLMALITIGFKVKRFVTYYLKGFRFIYIYTIETSLYIQKYVVLYHFFWKFMQQNHLPIASYTTTFILLFFIVKLLSLTKRACILIINTCTTKNTFSKNKHGWFRYFLYLMQR